MERLPGDREKNEGFSPDFLFNKLLYGLKLGLWHRQFIL